MIGKLVLTLLIFGAGAFLLLSDSFEVFISPYANAVSSDIENIKNDPVMQSGFSQVLDIIYENSSKIKFLLSDFFRN